MDNEHTGDISEPDESSLPADARPAKPADKRYINIRGGEGIIVDPGDPGANPFEQFQPSPEQPPQEPPPSSEPPPPGGGNDND